MNFMNVLESRRKPAGDAGADRGSLWPDLATADRSHRSPCVRDRQ